METLASTKEALTAYFLYLVKNVNPLFFSIQIFSRMKATR